MESPQSAPASLWAWIALSALLVVVVAIPGGTEFGRGWGPAVGALLFWSIALLRRWRWARVILAVWSLASASVIAVVLIANGGPADLFAVAFLFAAGTFVLTRPSMLRWFSDRTQTPDARSTTGEAGSLHPHPHARS